MLWKDKLSMKALHLKRLILGLIVVLVGCDVTLLFAAQATAADINASDKQLATKPITPAVAITPPTSQVSPTQPLQQLQTQQLQQLQALQQAPQMPVNTAPPSISNQAVPQATTVPATTVPQNAIPPIVNPASLPPFYQSPANEEAFNGVAQNALPMSPEQIQRLRQLFNNSQLAASAPAGVPARPTASSQMVHLEPGATPPVIRLGQGFVSSLVFLDSTGAPWPIEAYDVGNPTAFNIQWNRTDNTLLIQSSSLYTYGNLAVRLKDLVTPVMLTLIPGQKAIDYRVDLRIQGLGPNASQTPLGNNLPTSASFELLNVLDGIPPTGGKTVKISGGACQGWLFNNKLYLRTRLTVLSPAWMATMSSADGMKAYEMQKTPMLLVSQDGKVAQLKVEGL